MTGQATEDLLNEIRRRIPRVAIRTTFLVGFPGETAEEFDELLAFVMRFRFDALGVFRFSLEPGTAAADMPDAVSDELAARRAERIMLAQQEIVFEANRSSVGGAVEVLVDGTDASGRSVARTCRQAPEVDSVCLLTGPAPAGEIVPGKVVGYDGYDLIVAPAGDGRAGDDAA